MCYTLPHKNRHAAVLKTKLAEELNVHDYRLYKLRRIRAAILRMLPCRPVAKTAHVRRQSSAGT